MKALFLSGILLLASNGSLAGENELPLKLAVDAAQAAIQACELDGYHITAAVVDVHGALKVLLKGDDSTVHTKDTAFRKAYTVVTLGPVFNWNASSEAAAAMNGKPGVSSFAAIPNIALMPGAVAIKKGGHIVAALGVGGAPGGARDEACAAKGVKAIADKL